MKLALAIITALLLTQAHAESPMQERARILELQRRQLEAEEAYRQELKLCLQYASMGALNGYGTPPAEGEDPVAYCQRRAAAAALAYY